VSPWCNEASFSAVTTSTDSTHFLPLRCSRFALTRLYIRMILFESQKSETKPMDFAKPGTTWALFTTSFICSCHNIKRKGGGKKITYLLLCVFNLKTQTTIPVLFVNFLMDFDASVPIDQIEPSLIAERTAGSESWNVSSQKHATCTSPPRISPETVGISTYQVLRPLARTRMNCEG
jgi:hypothetical protein